MNLTKIAAAGGLSLLFIVFAALPAISQDVAELTEGDEIVITLDEAIQIALVNNYMLRKGILDLDRAEAQIREAWGTVYPQVNASGSYTRNLRTPNPFAGSDAGGLFESFGAVDWLAYNESARTDNDPNTEPIPLDEYVDRQMQGYRDAGITPPGMSGDNPFAVENQFEFGLSVTQAIYNGAAFSAIKAARQFRELNEDQVQADRQQVVNEVKNSFYSALLAKEQVEVLRTSVERLRKTVEETRRSVEAGVLSKYDRVSAEVELVNLETNLIEAENQAELAAKNLALQLGISTKKSVKLRGSLEYDDSLQPDVSDSEIAYEIALQQRPDIRQTASLLELRKIEGDVTRSRFLPTLNAFANFAYIGSVPNNRTSISPVEGQEFSFTSSDRSFFDDSYWNEAVSVGLRMNWSIFNGFQTKMQVQQNKIDVRQAEIDREMQQNAVYLEIDQTLKNLETALQRIRSQERNLEQAEMNYEFALKRLQEGAGTSLQERQASSLLDQSKLNYLSAVYDYLTALSQYEKSIGKPVLDTE
ncbi:TolC family protein [Rhodohalobacter halophilus]|uniref:TolC family protein n=1 Tax=Rhodohalobacter halophilus TaxID=1812810 RepID=UPI00083F5971|nr:TolC family protein [Rhodohalobacter halophilus]